MKIPPSLNSLIDWVKVLRLLDIEVDAAVLPCVVPCPVAACVGQLTLVHDYSGGGAWTYCTKCRFAGDMIELAAAHWGGLEIPVTIKKLISLGIEVPPGRDLPPEIDTYIYLHTDKRKRMQELWQQARKRLLVDDSKVLRALQHKLGIRLNLERDRWLQGPGLFIGGHDRKYIEAIFTPKVAINSPGMEYRSGQRVLPGSNWTDALVIPLHDYPGRIKSFIFYGREGRMPEDVAHRLIRYSNAQVLDNVTHKNKEVETNCGIALYDAIQFAKDDLIVMADPFMALRMQCWHLQDNGEPAPLVSILKTKMMRTSPEVWHHIKQRPIFWGSPTGELFRHAKATNASICLTGHSIKGPPRTMKTFTKIPLNEWLQRVRLEAQPWDVVLERMLAELPSVEAETLLIGMELTTDELETLLRKCPDELQDKLQPYLTKNAVRKTISGNNRIREENGWYNETTGEQICNAILRVDKVIYHDKKNVSYYSGRILFKGHEVPFYELADVVEDDPFKWMRSRLLKAHAGFLEYSKRWTQQLMGIAVAFHMPETIRGLDAIGWDAEEAGFVFPSFIITNKGDIRNQELKTSKRRLPAIGLEPPVNMTAADISSFPTDGSAVFWALAASIASNILAPIFSVPQSAIGLTGDGSTTGLSVAKMLGCMEQSVRSFDDADGEETLSTVCAEHGWPLILKPIGRREGWTEWLASDERRNCITPLSWYAAKSLTVKPGWHVIETGSIEAIKISDAVRKVLPSFLQYVAKQRFKLPAGYDIRQGTAFAHAVLVWLSQWYASIGGDHRVVINALKVASFDGGEGRRKHIVNSFTDLLCKWFDDGELALERAGFIPANKAIKALICFPGEHGTLGKIFIPKALLNKLLVEHSAPSLDVSSLSRILVESGAAEEFEYAGLSGWMIEEETWNTRLKAWRAWHRYKLRVS